jgi:hypothetical protein
MTIHTDHLDVAPQDLEVMTRTGLQDVVNPTTTGAPTLAPATTTTTTTPLRSVTIAQEAWDRLATTTMTTPAPTLAEVVMLDSKHLSILT